jgi:poly-gamma-glutamate capsule biosynthesis protein CapA/YwtB (metallophosphatase superfamily)
VATPRDLEIAAVGDVTLGKAWPPGEETLPPNDARDLFADVRPLFAGADLVFGNLETVLADQGESTKCGKKKTHKCYAFRAPAGYARTLKETGFNVMSIANNHAGDFGPDGRQATIAALDAAGIRHSGPVGDLAALDLAGHKVGLIAFAFGTEMYRIQEIEPAKAAIAELKKQHPLVVVSFHNGAEGLGASHVPRGTEIFLNEDRGDPRAFAHAAIDAGADLVLGHGPHLLRAMEIYKGHLIVYSLGNFSAWENFSLSAALGITVVLRATIAPDGRLKKAQLIPIKIEPPGHPVPDPERRAIALIRSLSAEDIGDALFDPDGAYVAR